MTGACGHAEASCLRASRFGAPGTSACPPEPVRTTDERTREPGHQRQNAPGGGAPAPVEKVDSQWPIR
jgi:hypothetical protein